MFHEDGAATPGRRLPVSLLTGFLGSGKTTVLRHVLRHPDFARTAVIINEFGAVGLDHELVERSTDEDDDGMVLLQSGCLCCTVRGDLINTLSLLFLRRVRGEIMEFDRVVIETTGLADPAPILHTLMTDPLVAARYALDGVITTVDAAAGMATLDRHPESVKQVAVADRVLLTKIDLVGPAEAAALRQRVKALNPAAPIVPSLDGVVQADDLFGAGLYDPRTKTTDVQRWLNAEAYEVIPRHGHAHDHDHGHDHGHDHDVNRHDDRIRAVCLTVDDPIPGDAFDRWLETVILLKGPDVLRIKGIVNIQGLKGPFVFHGVQHIFHPPVMLKRWPGKDRRTRIVFITRDLDVSALSDTLAMFIADETDAPPLPSRIDAGDPDIALFQVPL